MRRPYLPRIAPAKAGAQRRTRLKDEADRRRHRRRVYCRSTDDRLQIVEMRQQMRQSARDRAADAERDEALIAKTPRDRRPESREPEGIETDMRPIGMKQGIGDRRPPQRRAAINKSAVDLRLHRIGVLRRRDDLRDPAWIEDVSEAPRHEAEVDERPDILLKRQNLPQQMHAEQQPDERDDHRGDVENSLPLWLHLRPRALSRALRPIPRPRLRPDRRRRPSAPAPLP